MYNYVIIPALWPQIRLRRCLGGLHYGLYQLIVPPHPHQQWCGLPQIFLESEEMIVLINETSPYFNVNSQTFPSTASHTHTIVVHLTLSLRCQVSAPADDLAVFPSTTEQSAALQGAQGEHTAFMGSGLTHYLEGLYGK